MESDDLSQLHDFWLACGLPESACPAALTRFQQYRQLIEAHNAAASLMGPAGVGDFYLKHVADSLAVLIAWPELASGPLRLADVGAGAGLPGLVLAIALERVQLTAIESNQRKAEFVRLAAGELGLADRVRVVSRRSRELGQEGASANQFDVIVARAVAAADKLIRDNRRLLAPGGSMILYKTPSSLGEELHLAQREADKYGLTVTVSEPIDLPAGAGARQFIRSDAPI